MNKKVEYKVQINPMSLGNPRMDVYDNAHYSNIQKGYLTGTLIIDVPEKEIKLTESKLDEAWGSFNFPERDRFKKRLFGEANAP